MARVAVALVGMDLDGDRGRHHAGAQGQAPQVGLHREHGRPASALLHPAQASLAVVDGHDRLAEAHEGLGDASGTAPGVEDGAGRLAEPAHDGGHLHQIGVAGVHAVVAGALLAAETSLLVLLGGELLGVEEDDDPVDDRVTGGARRALEGAAGPAQWGTLVERATEEVEQGGVHGDRR